MCPLEDGATLTGGGSEIGLVLNVDGGGLALDEEDGEFERFGGVKREGLGREVHVDTPY